MLCNFDSVLQEMGKLQDISLAHSTSHCNAIINSRFVLKYDLFINIQMFASHGVFATFDRVPGLRLVSYQIVLYTHCDILSIICG